MEAFLYYFLSMNVLMIPVTQILVEIAGVGNSELPPVAFSRQSFAANLA
ncbi:MAG: hypothetical protein NUV34_09935 [Sulfuricaulis sp.]|nr:hypothetical protein [Sulfuricaulis sp.]